LALYGETSPYSKMAAHLAKLMPRTCCHEVIEATGHFYAVHKPQVAVERLLPFLRDPEGFIEQKKAGSEPAEAAVGPAPIQAQSVL
jgi:hypothetical protein